MQQALSRAGVVPEAIRCSTKVRWEPSLERYARKTVEGLEALWGIEPDPVRHKKAVHHALGYLVRLYYDQTAPQNLGATVVQGLYHRDDRGRSRPVVLFRSAVTTSPGGRCPCFESLVHAGGVRHVVNLYSGTFPFGDMIEHEKQLAARLNVTYFDAGQAPELEYRSLIEDPRDYETNRRRAMTNLARLIREQLLRPQGKPPGGNLYIHCGGGMHRSGMLFGVVQRCINREPMDQIETDYKRHTSYVSARQPGGYEPLNIRFIREFDCGLLQTPGRLAPHASAAPPLGAESLGPGP